MFLSYRREDAAGYAGRLYDRLKTQFPGRVFIDVGEIEPGTDFVAALEQAIMRSRVLLVVIGKRWLNERLPYSSDFVRVEIAAALKRNMRLIPVLVGGATMPAASDLPEDLSALVRRQAFVLSDASWDLECGQLLLALERDLGKPTARRPWLPWAIASGVVVAALSVPAYYFILRPKDSGGTGRTEVPKAEIRKFVETQKEGIGAMTTGLQHVIDQMQGAGQATLNVSGRVLDKVTGKPLEAAQVMVTTVGGTAFTHSTKTGPDGRFTLPFSAQHTKIDVQAVAAGGGSARVTLDAANAGNVELLIAR